MADKLIKKSVLIIAPHVFLPVRNGADKYIHKKWTNLPENCSATYIYADGVYKSLNGDFEKTTTFSAKDNNELSVILKFLFLGGQYLYHKYCNKIILGELLKVRDQKFDIIVCSFFSTYVLAYEFFGEPGKYLIESHNYDPKIYFDRARESDGLKKMLYVLASYRAYKSIVAARNLYVCALGNSDAGIFNAVLSPSNKIFTGGIGCEIYRGRKKIPKEGDCVISFVGSLGIQMNCIAITKFINQKWGIILKNNPKAKLRVVGSNPTRDLVDLVNNYPSIELHANVPDEVLVDLVQTSCVTIIPFNDLNGLKLKMYMSIEMGVPFVSYSMLTDDSQIKSVSLVTEEPLDILRFALSASSAEFIRMAENLMSEFCKNNSWGGQVKNNIEMIS